MGKSKKKDEKDKKSTKYVYILEVAMLKVPQNEKPARRQGANLAEMVNIGLTGSGRIYFIYGGLYLFYDNNKTYPKSLYKEVDKALERLEKKWEQNSVMLKILYWYPYAPEPEPQCPE